jgi:hypothetical protein
LTIDPDIFIDLLAVVIIMMMPMAFYYYDDAYGFVGDLLRDLPTPLALQ